MLFALLALSAAGTAYPDPLSPAAAGKVQCYAPTDHKTCASLAGYAAGGNGQFANIATVLLSANPIVIMKTTTQVRVRNGAVCGAVEAADITGGSLTVGGNTVPADKAAPVLQHIAEQLTPIIGHEICTVYVPQGNGLMAEATMDGKRQPNQDQRVIWVSPADGYTVAP